MEIGRVIDRHYLVQRLVRQGQVGTVYQGFDQRLQRVVALKVVPGSHAPFYEDAAHLTAHFSHPNIIMLYDLIPTAETLYIVQEYVEGQDFAALAQMQLSPYEVVDIGRQICSALIYAGSSIGRICHGDLTPPAILRDQRGTVRVSNFALPGDLRYFTTWSILGGDGVPLLQLDLPPGVDSEERRADDTRAVGLLLYQLLVGRLEPPADGQLRFSHHVPRDVCEVVARAILRQHPQHIKDAATFYDDLNALAELLEPPVIAPASEPAQASYQPPVPVQMSPAVMRVPPAVLPGSHPQGGRGFSAYAAAPDPRFEAATALESNAAPTVADPALMVAPALPQAQRSSAADVEAPSSSRGFSLWMWLLLGLVIFALFFIVGYFAGVFLVR